MDQELVLMLSYYLINVSLQLFAGGAAALLKQLSRLSGSELTFWEGTLNTG